MSFWEPPPTSGPLGVHRILSPTAAVKVSPIALGGISIGNSWSEVFGENEDPFKLLDAYFSIGGNFIDTASVYCHEDSEKLIGEWMESRKNRDQMVVATKYSAGYRAWNAAEEPMQSNYTGNSAKSMQVSVHDSLRKLRTDYVDILYVHWWEGAASVYEVMRHLHKLVLAGKVLYLGISNAPGWVVTKANEFARSHGLTPFSIYQGRWNAAFRDMEAEIIPMCEEEGMAIVPWAALGGGNLLSAEQREQQETVKGARPARGLTDHQVEVSKVLEEISKEKSTTFQAVTLAYLFSQSVYVFPIVGVQTVEHIKAMPEAIRIKLSPQEIARIHQVSKFAPQYPISFLYNFRGDQPYSLALTTANHQQYQMSARIAAPPKPSPYAPLEE